MWPFILCLVLSVVNIEKIMDEDIVLLPVILHPQERKDLYIKTNNLVQHASNNQCHTTQPEFRNRHLPHTDHQIFNPKMVHHSDE